MRLAKDFSAVRMEAAAARALAYNALSYTSVHAILEKGLDKVPADTAPAAIGLPGSHHNLRGAAYYQPKGGVH